MNDSPQSDWLGEVAKRLHSKRDSGTRVDEVLTVREFLGKFGNARRGRVVVNSIRRALDFHGLRTSPDFELEYVDNPIRIELDSDNTANEADGEFADPTVRIGILRAAHNSPVSVKPDDPLARATTIMAMNEYSQLPVLTTPKSVKGVISWQSIGKAYADGRSPQLARDCMEDAHPVNVKMTLAEAIREIRRHDYVLVIGEDKSITGIVTATDLADQFHQLAYPFLLIGEVERHLRNLVAGKFEKEELADVGRDGGDSKNIEGPDDLTFGDF